VRRAAVALSILAAFAAVPPAFAWTPFGGGVQNTVVPSMLVTRAGTELVSFDSPVGGTISVARAGGAPRVLVSGDAAANRTQLVQQQNGAIQLYYPSAAGVARLTSTDDGQTWSGPAATQSHTTGPVMAAAVAPDGTPYFAQDSTAGVNVFRGLGGETAKNVFPRCCGYAESLAVDSTGLVQVAFFSNATANGTFVYEPLAGDLSPAGSIDLEPTGQHTDRVPLVADTLGNTFLAWPPGSPNATGLTVVPFRGGRPAGDGVGFHGTFGGGDPHMALTLDTRNRLWIVWTGGGAVHAARSRSNGRHFGAVVSMPVPGTTYQASAAGIDGEPGSADVIVNTGSALLRETLRPGLSVRTFRTTAKAGRKRVVIRWAQALDDGFAVPTATFRIKGRTIHANAGGKAKVPAGSGKAAAPGYAGASFRSP
jgi:hypothetical protein